MNNSFSQKQTNQLDFETNNSEKDNDLINSSMSSSEKKSKKTFVERVGDWVCFKCKNLNFSFRVICNRCQTPKFESDKMFEQYMGNLLNYVKFNEIMQNNILMNQQYNMFNNQGFVNNNNININNNFYNNDFNNQKNYSNNNLSSIPNLVQNQNQQQAFLNNDNFNNKFNNVNKNQGFDMKNFKNGLNNNESYNNFEEESAEM